MGPSRGAVVLVYRGTLAQKAQGRQSGVGGPWLHGKCLGVQGANGGGA